MRILIASPYLPWPLNSGGNASQFSTLRSLAQDHEFVFIYPVFDKGSPEYTRILAKELPQVAFFPVFCGTIARPREPLPYRLLRRASRWLQPRLVRSGSLSVQSTPLPWNPFTALPRAFVDALCAEVEKHPDIVQCEFVEMISLGNFLPKGTPKIFVNHQIHHVYSRRFLQVHGSTPYGEYLAASMKAQEIGYLRAFDAVVTFSEVDRQTLALDLPIDRIFCSPFPIPSDVAIAARPNAQSDGRFVFIGSELHHPNADALSWLLKEIWPRIAAQVPNPRLEVIGQWSEHWTTLTHDCRVSFVGFAPDINAALRRGIMLVPLRIGSGIRTKILAAFGCGMPVVSTTVGAEGLIAADGREFLIGDTVEAFAAAAAGLSQNPSLQHRLAVSGLSYVTRHHSPAAVRARRNEVYQAVRNLAAGQSDA